MFPLTVGVSNDQRTGAGRVSALLIWIKNPVGLFQLSCGDLKCVKALLQPIEIYDLVDDTTGDGM